MHPDEQLTGMALEARWHTVAVLLVLPMLLLGMVTLAVLVVGATEMALATVQRRRRGPQVPRPARPVPVLIRRFL
jgi:hypothetical protein